MGFVIPVGWFVRMNQATGLTTTVVTHVLFVEQVKFLSFLVPYAGRFAGTTGWNGVAF